MSFINLVDTHFNPCSEVQQLKETQTRDVIGIIGAVTIATALIGYQFFAYDIQTTAILSGTGTACCASYLTGKDGYIWCAAGAALTGLGIATVEAIRDKRFYVVLNIDIAEILRAIFRK